MKNYIITRKTKVSLPDDFQFPSGEVIDAYNRLVHPYELRPYNPKSICRNGCPYCHNDRGYDCWGHYENDWVCLCGSCMFVGSTIEEDIDNGDDKNE